MAYNYGFPVGYQSPYQPAYYPMQANNAPTQQGNSIIWVQGEAAAKSYAVAPNSNIALWDSEANVIYVKSADASGIPSMKIIDYTVRDNALKPSDNKMQNNYVTKDDLLPIEDEINNLKAQIKEKGGHNAK